jgi:hypothetical protein
VVSRARGWSWPRPPAAAGDPQPPPAAVPGLRPTWIRTDEPSSGFRSFPAGTPARAETDQGRARPPRGHLLPSAFQEGRGLRRKSRGVATTAATHALSFGGGGVSRRRGRGPGGGGAEGAELRGAAHGPAPPVSGSAPPLSREARDASGTAPSRQRGPPFPAAAPPGRAGGPRGSPGRGSRRPRGTAAGRGARRPPWSWGGARTEGVLSPGSFSLEGPRGREEGSDGVPSSLAGGSQPAWRLEGSAQ